MFGRFEASRGGVPLAGLHLRQGERLLAFLALHRGPAGVTYRTLAEHFWPAEAWHNPGTDGGDFAGVRQAVRSLRVALGPDAVRLTSPARSVVALDLDGADVDLAAFARLAGESGSGGPAAWREAVSLYRAPLLDGWTEAWAGRARLVVQREYERLLRRLVDAAREGGDAAGEAETLLRRLLSAAPADEDAARRLMAVLGARGRYAEARETFDALRAALCAAGDAAPAPPTVALMERLSEEAATAPLPPPPHGAARSVVASLPPGGGISVAPEIAAVTEPSGGALDLGSPYYVVRDTDRAFEAAVARGDSIVLLKGARQMGKTSLLARGLAQARASRATVVLTDWGALPASRLASVDLFFRSLAATIADQLDLDFSPRRDWDEEFDAGVNMERFLKRRVLASADRLVWGVDEADRLFGLGFASEVFGLIRSWHNRRALDPTGPWSRLTMAITYATEAHLLIADANRSPFNVGTRLALADFDPAQTGELNRGHGSPLRDADETARFHALVGGHPYLTQRGLAEIASGRMRLEDLERQGDRDEGPFADHLRRLLAAARADGEMCAALRDVVCGGTGAPVPLETFFRLRSAGLIAGESTADVRPRCRLYAAYFARHLC
jgi:DNA-binding SARP family transcriptional activator